MSDRPGAVPLAGGRVRFRTWAPRADKVEVILAGGRAALMEPADRGYHEVVLDDVEPGALYRYRLDGEAERADPASLRQPSGVHGPSAVVNPSYAWTDGAWTGVPLERFVLYEIHVGTFTPAGTFAAAAGVLDDLADLGVTAVELMPVAAFPGERNWGYDGVFPFAVQESYGGPDGLKAFVDAAHARGLAVVLDVVYNHLGPEGSHVDDFGPYFTDRYATPWGRAMNFDGADSDEVRAFFVANAVMWLRDYHLDGLRLDAVHAIVDSSPRPFVAEVAAAVREVERRTGRTRALIAESDLNDPRTVIEESRGGYGCDGVWADDLHHAIHSVLTGERDGYYIDYGEVSDVAGALERGFLYDGRYSAYRRRSHGAPASAIPGHRFVVCAQNHDQVGNRMLGERLGALADFERLKLAAGLVLLSPYTPLIFMGEEYGETAPFQYFVHHSEPKLIDAVRRGRAEEFAAFAWDAEPPDPQDPATFARSRLDRSLAEAGGHRVLRELYRTLLALAREIPALASRRTDEAVVSTDGSTITLRRRHDASETAAIFNLADEPASVALPSGGWRRLLDSASPDCDGPGPTAPEKASGEVHVQGWAFVLYERERA